MKKKDAKSDANFEFFKIVTVSLRKIFVSFQEL